MLVLLGTVLVRTAWLTDDAYLTFRTVDNLHHGYGLRWNVAERVQAYTHPLWMVSLAAITRLTGEFYLTSIALSIVLSVLTASLLVFTLASSPLWGLLGIMLLTLSRAFIDYSTSGLENALSHFLLVLFFAALFRVNGRRNLLGVAVTAAFWCSIERTCRS
jgi:arabinofuranosyltransferase